MFYVASTAHRRRTPVFGWGRRTRTAAASNTAAAPVNDNYKYTWRQLEICMADSVFRQRLDLCTATFEMRTADTDLPVPGEMKPRTV
jgi:hypothetical protein